jgi:hypothetical protein
MLICCKKIEVIKLKINVHAFITLILLCISLLFLASNAWSQANSNKPTSKQVVEARALVDAATKNACVGFWTESESKKRALRNAGITLSDQCGCTQNEVNYLINDDLVINVNKEFDVWVEGTPVPNNLAKWYKIVFQSMERCSEKLMKRR